MTFIPTLDDSKPRPRLARTLDTTELRVLGSLMEKQLTTPEYYPLTMNALVAACNQKSNREPVTDLGETEIGRALERLQDEKLAWRVVGGRAVRFDHNLDKVWHLNQREKAILTLLFLRGPQTAGELRGRADRLFAFESVAEVEEVLRDMAAHSEPLVQELPRRPGQKEQRWATTAGGAVSEPVTHAAADTPHAGVPAGEPMSVRVTRLEQRVEELSAALLELKEKLGGF
jgi:hypothetical protein